MRVSIKKTRPEGRISVNQSKSLGHRYLILASQLEEKSTIKINSISKDISTSLEILQALGSDIEISNSAIRIGRGQTKYPKTINFGESGSSLRFLLPYAFLVERDLYFEGRGKLPERPIADLIDELEKKGVFFDGKKLPFRAAGKIQGGTYNFPYNVSSQYISAIMLIGHRLGVEIRTDKRPESLSYIRMTEKTLEDFGIHVDHDPDYKNIRIGRQKAGGPVKIDLEGDWSNAILFIAMGLLNGDVRIDNLNLDSVQGDAKIFSILRDAGAHISYQDGILRARKSSFKGLDLDVSDMLDLVPVLSVLLTRAETKSRLVNIRRLSYKESDRIQSILALGEALGADFTLDGDDLVIRPSKLKKGLVKSYNDHRIVMAAIAASCLTDLVIEGFEAIDKSYKNIDESLSKLGVKYENRK